MFRLGQHLQLGTAAVGLLLGGMFADSASRPNEGEPNTDFWPGEREDSSTADGRRYGDDGRAEVDCGHDRGNHVGLDGEPL